MGVFYVKKQFYYFFWVIKHEYKKKKLPRHFFFWAENKAQGKRKQKFVLVNFFVQMQHKGQELGFWVWCQNSTVEGTAHLLPLEVLGDLQGLDQIPSLLQYLLLPYWIPNRVSHCFCCFIVFLFAGTINLQLPRTDLLKQNLYRTLNGA